MGWVRLRSSITLLGFIGVLLAGCRPSEEPVPAPPATAAPLKLKLLSLDDPQEVAGRIAQLWSAETAGEVELVYDSSAAVFSAPQIPDCDVVIFPSVQLGELLGRNAIQPIESKTLRELGVDRNAQLRLDRTAVVQSGRSIYGTSLGSPMLVLLYRRDVLDAIQREVPRTWSEYLELTRALAQVETLNSADGKPLPTSVAEPFGEHWGAEMFLIRAAGMIQRPGRLSSYFDVESIDALVDTPPFVAALESMKEQWVDSDPGERTPADCYQEMVRGNAALAICWPSGQTVDQEGLPSLAIGVAALPGADRVYDYREQTWLPLGPEELQPSVLVPVAGRMASISAQTRRLRSAQRFVAWLSGPETNRQFSPQFSDTLFVHDSAAARPSDWVQEPFPPDGAQQMAETLRGYHQQPGVLQHLRVLDREKYRSLLADAVRRALGGDESPQAALERVAAEWNRLTDSVGRSRQRELFQGSVHNAQ
jgi:multiple sugar transport system substrate-binding protein